MSLNNFVGTWEIVACFTQTGNIEKSGIEGTIFQLNKTGDVTWKVPGGAVVLPLFSCETYEVISKSAIDGAVIRFGAYNGHVLEFKVEESETRDEIILNCERWCYFKCRRVDDTKRESIIDAPFSLLPALEDGYFSDLSIVSNKNKSFPVHSCILKLSAPDLDWSSRPPPFSGLPEDVLGTILHYLYSQCLPSGLEEKVARQVVTAVSELPGLDPLVHTCQLYLKNMALKQQIISLVSDIHACGAQIIQYFSTKNFGSTDHSNSLASDPAKLCFAVKSSVRETAVAGAKLILLCDVYIKRKGELSREECHEIIKYVKSRIPMFMNQLNIFLEGVKNTFSNLLPPQKQEVACYLVPEIETILDTLSTLLCKIKASLEIILTQSQVEFSKNTKSYPEDSLEKSIHHDFNRKELSKLRSFHQKITLSLLHLQQKKQNFYEMSNVNKVRSVTRDLEQVMEELPVFLLRLEEVTLALDEKLEWTESKFCFKVGTSKVSGVLNLLYTHREVLQEVMLHLCDLVQRDTFTQSLQCLGLLDSTQTTTATEAQNATNLTGDSKCKHNQSSKSTPKHLSYKLNLVESLCISPHARQNRLSKAAIRLLKSGQSTDMTFEVISCGDNDRVIDHSTGSTGSTTPTEADCENDVYRIEAHRVIIAARCDWFRRALLSGMQEDINRKIEVHNTSPYLFSLFLEYLYSGVLDYTVLSVDHLTELLLLSDQYEVDSLKQACEHGLKMHLDEDSVLYFFSMADRFNAKLLKSACVQFIAQKPDIMDSEVFEELPDNLQAEIYDLVIWVKPQHMYLSGDRLLDKCSPDTPNSLSSSLADMEEMAANLHINSRDANQSDISSYEDLQLNHDTIRLESALHQLRDIVGHNTSRDDLVQFILAADFDINRAVNFYYSAS